MGKRNEGLSSCSQDADDVVQEMDVQIEQKWPNWRVAPSPGVFTEDRQVREQIRKEPPREQHMEA